MAGILQRMQHQLRQRYELMRVRLSLRKITDSEYIGRMFGLFMFPAVFYGCGGFMSTYSKDRVHVALAERRGGNAGDAGNAGHAGDNGR